MTRHLIARRTALTGLATLAAAPALASARNPWAERVVGIERRLGGRLGVAILDTGSNQGWGHRADERFAMCSTFKWMVAASVLARVDAGHERLDREIAYGKADLLGNSPTTEANVAKGRMSVGALCAAAVEESDNAAANLLLRESGGPKALTAWLRATGDGTTRVDRTEPEMNHSGPGDPRDTTTPDAEIKTLRQVLLGQSLAPASRDRLVDWMKAVRTGPARLKAGLPKSWTIAHKTGTMDGRYPSCNDVAVAWPPGRAPILIAVFSNGGSADTKTREHAVAHVGRLVGEWAGA